MAATNPNPSPDGWHTVETPQPTEEAWDDLTQAAGKPEPLDPRQDFAVDDVNQTMTKTDTPQRQWFEQ